MDTVSPKTVGQIWDTWDNLRPQLSTLTNPPTRNGIRLQQPTNPI